MKIGLGSYALAWSAGVPGYETADPWDAFRMLRFAHELGFPVIQMADNCSLAALDAQSRRQFLDEAALYGMEVEVGGRGLRPDHLHSCLQLAVATHSRLCRMVIDGPGFEPDLPAIIEILREARPFLQQHNVILALENHDRLHASEFVEILESVASPLIGICLDTVNSLGACEGLETIFETLAPYTVNLHIKDYRIRRADHKMGFLVEGTPAGQGMLPIARIVRRLRILGRCQTGLLELWPAPEASADLTAAKEQQWCRESAAFLQQFNR